jgi:uncharacterized protein YceH (UPF0502 family)
MYQFEDLDAVHSALQLLMKRDPPLVAVLPRQPGTKEVRYAHLLCGEIRPQNSENHLEKPVTPKSAEFERLRRLEDEVATLQTDIASLKEQFANFRKQFE